MQADEFRKAGHEIIDWVADYLENAERYPVLPATQPGDIRRRLPASPPEKGEPMERILADFNEIIMPGVTHWNHPRFFAYFPANNSGPSILGETLSAALGVNSMIWQTCPAATELEEVVLDWLRQLADLPADLHGVIQDTASTSTLVALVCARERLSGRAVNREGFEAGARGGTLRVYASREAHSSVEKGAKIAGFGAENVVCVGIGPDFAMDPADLEQRISADRKLGLRPCAIVATVGTTSSTAIDPVREIGEIARREGLWLHVDAALAGSAALLPEKRWIFNGIEYADSLVFNPHKWLFTNFDCSAFYVRDVAALTSSFAITPEYLRTAQDALATNFRDWGIQLGRRFRALKLWFVLRHYGAEGLRARLREHIRLAGEFRRWVDDSDQFELLAPVPVNTVCFRANPAKRGGAPIAEPKLDALNEALLHEVNASGRIYITHTRLNGRYTLRFCVGQTQTQERHVAEGWRCLTSAQTIRGWRP